MSRMTTITLADIQAAQKRIADGIYYSPCPLSEPLSDLCGAEVYCKLDLLQRTGSFKERGARNALLLLPEAIRRKGVVAASAGNHALALAYHAKQMQAPATVFMPLHAPLVKQLNCRRLGATVILLGESFQEAREAAEAFAKENGLTYVHGYDDPAIIAGQGTMGLEILEQVKDIDAIIIPIGGGGLIAGVATAVKALKPSIRIIGVEPFNSRCFSSAVAAGEPVRVPTLPTLADGLAVSVAGGNSLQTAAGKIDKFVSVRESDLALAVVRLMEREKIVAEGAGAASLAALLGGHLPELAGKRVVLLLCGGNIDLTILSRLIEGALVLDGRLTRFTATISDRPGGLAKFTALVAQTGASIKEVMHDRTFCGPNIAAVNVRCVVETRDQAHINELYAHLTEAGIPHFAHATDSES